MRRLLSGPLGLIIFLGLLEASRAEEPSSFLDLRLAVAPYSRLTYDELQPLHLSLSFGFLRWGFVVVDVDHGAYEVDYEEESGQTFRVLAGIRLRGPDLLDAAGNGLLLESALALGYERSPGGRDAPHFRMSLSALYWFWRGRLAAGIELGSDIGFSTGTHAALVTAVAFPWSDVGAEGVVPSAQLESGESPDEWLDIRFRVSPMYCKLGMPNSLGAVGLSATLTILGHFVLEYGLDWTFHAHMDSTLAHTAMLGGRIRALDLRNGAGSGLVVDTAILLGYSHYVTEVYGYNRITLESVGLRQDWDLIYWFTRNFGAGLWLSLGYILPVHAGHTSSFVDEDDVEAAMQPHGGLGAAFVFAAAF